jgi:hypothetical protein
MSAPYTLTFGTYLNATRADWTAQSKVTIILMKHAHINGQQKEPERPQGGGEGEFMLPFDFCLSPCPS